jgi:hypothetical protein
VPIAPVIPFGTSNATGLYEPLGFEPPSTDVPSNAANGIVNVASAPYSADMTGVNNADAAFTAAETAGVGGEFVIPPGVVKLSTWQAIKGGTWRNNSSSLIPVWLANFGETIGSKLTKLLDIFDFGPGTVGKIRIGKMDRMLTAGVNGTIASNSSADIARVVNATKNNFSSGSAVNGEIDGLYIIVRQGGSGLADAGGILVDVQSYDQGSFSCYIESTVNVSVFGTGTVYQARSQWGGAGNSGATYGLNTVVDHGTMVDGNLVQVATGSAITHFMRLSNANATQSGGATTTYDFLGTGQTQRAITVSLGANLNNVIVVDSVKVPNTNSDELATTIVRQSNGFDWQTAKWLLSRKIDGTDFSDLFFRSLAGGQASVGFSSFGGIYIGVEFTTDNKLGFFGATPVVKPTLNAAATDAATTMALTNQIRAALISYGLAQ